MDRALRFRADMRIREIMSSPVETVQFDDSAEHAWHRMRASRIHHLVVLDGATVVGVLSHRDLGGEHGSAVRNNMKVEQLMTRSYVTADADTTVRAAANQLRGHLIGCLPVMDGDRLVGMVTITDLLTLLGHGSARPTPPAERRILKARGPRQKPIVQVTAQEAPLEAQTAREDFAHRARRAAK
jgi:CBS domain-containing protein